MSQDKTLNIIIDIVKKELNPVKIYLFGSRARGDHHIKSDYDILIVLNDVRQPKYKLLNQIYMATFDVPARIDFLIYTQSEFDEWKNEFGAIAYDCSREGILLNV